MFVCCVSSTSVLNVTVNYRWFMSAYIHYIDFINSIIRLTVFIL